MEAPIAVIAEQSGGIIQPVTYEAVSFAVELGQKLDRNVLLVIFGKSVGDPAKQIAEKTGTHVIAIESEQLGLYNGDVYKAAALKALETLDPAYICLPHTAMGFDLAPRLASCLNASCITAVEKVRTHEGNIRFIRSVFNGKLRAEMAPATACAILTILPGAWAPFEIHPESKGSVHIIRTDFAPVASRTMKIKESEKRKLNLGDAEVIISAGRGIRNPENLHLLEQLAKIFPKSALGSSKGACDLGWLGYERQIGVTGQTVSPRLYIACGISGAVQHLSGMKRSQIIVGINSDPDASIFTVADYGIVENLETFIPTLLEEFRHFSASP
jgi:electron transfer flavoprotein alpha subunit